MFLLSLHICTKETTCWVAAVTGVQCSWNFYAFLSLVCPFAYAPMGAIPALNTLQNFSG
jgi:hypothetical protein